MFDNENASSARRKQEPGSLDVKSSLVNRAASYGVSRLIDRPNIGKRRRNRRNRRGLNIDLPTGGIPGTRIPTGSRRDVDFDGWADEGTTRPVWVGFPKIPKPKSINDKKKLTAITPVERLSSGIKKPSWPRKPTYGAFIDGADEIFGDAKTWQEFKKIYDDLEITFLDYETTGLVFDEFRKPSSNGKPVQIGLVKMKGGKVIDRLDLFMNPGEPLSEWSKNNLKGPNGERLTDKWLAGQISIAEAHKRVAEFVGEKGILGVQNASFDKDVLDDALDESSISWRPYGYLDTKEISDMVLPKWTPENQDGPYKVVDGNKVPSNGLADITKYLGVDLGEKHHYASADAEAAGMVMGAIIDGAIRNDWSKDVLDRNKRIEKLQRDRAAFREKIAKFENDKFEFLIDKTPKDEGRLSIGRERPIIKMTSDEVAKIKAHRQRKYKYGDQSLLHEGKEIRRNRNNWLEGMTPEQMANLLVPSSPEQQFEMWMDDFAPGARKIEQLKNAFKKYWDEFNEQNPWDRPDTSPESVLAMKNTLREALESNPNMRWAFEAHGAPMFGVWDAEAAIKWEERPGKQEFMDMISKSRGYKQKLYIRGKTSPFIDLVLFNSKAVIDRKTSEGENIPLSKGQLHSVRMGDAHIDDSIAGDIMHEWGHWLHFRAIRDYEGRTKPTQRAYYGSGIKNDSLYIAGLDVAQEYNSIQPNLQLIKLHEDGVPIDTDDKAPRTITSYAHVNLAEMMAEAITAILHPNKELSSSTLNAKLKKDAEILLGGDGLNFRPWETHAAKEVAIFKKQISSMTKKERRNRLSSGKADIFGLENVKKNYPRFERPPTQSEYRKGVSPKPEILQREIMKDRIDLVNSKITDLSFTDKSGKTQVIFGSGGRRNYDAEDFHMPLLIADALNFDMSEIEDIFPIFGETAPTLPKEKFLINAQYAPLLKDIKHVNKDGELDSRKLNKIQTTNISNFYDLPVSAIYQTGKSGAPHDYFVEFDAKTPAGEKMLKAMVVREFFKEWSISTSRPLSKLMSIAAGQLFGEEEKIDSSSFSERQQEFARELLSSIHSMTQAYFDSKGITHLTLFRGLLLKNKDLNEINGNDNSVDLSPYSTMAVTKGNNLSSWTSNLDMAITHSERPTDSNTEKSVLFKQIIPVEDVIGMELFGFGTRGENEFVTIGKMRPTLVFVGQQRDEFSGLPNQTNRPFSDMFIDHDDEDFYAYSKQLVKKLQSSDEADNKQIGKKLDEFIDRQEQSIGRLSSGRVAQTQETMQKAFRTTFAKAKFEEYDYQSDSPENLGVIPPRSSDVLSRELAEDARKILSVEPGLTPSKKNELIKYFEANPGLKPSDIMAKRAVSEILAELVDDDIEVIASLFHTIDSAMGLFPERHHEKLDPILKQEYSTFIKSNFGLPNEPKNLSESELSIRLSEDEFALLKLFGGLPDTPEKRAEMVSGSVQIRELIRKLKTGDVSDEDDYKFFLQSNDSSPIPRASTEILLKLKNVRSLRNLLLDAMYKKVFGGDGSVRPERRITEIFPKMQSMLNLFFGDDSNGPSFDSLEPLKKIQMQIIAERMVDDFFHDEYFFDEELEKDLRLSSPMPKYHRKRMYDILTREAGLSDDQMRMLGYYEDNNDFSNTIVAAVRPILHREPLISKRGRFNMFYTTDPDEFETVSVKEALSPGSPLRTAQRFRQIFNLEYGLKQSKEKSEPDIDTFDDGLNELYPSLLVPRRKDYQRQIIDKLFPQDKNNERSGPRKIRILIGEHESGLLGYLFEDSNLPTNYSPDSPGYVKRLAAYPKESTWRTVEIQLSENDNDAQAQLDEFFTKEYLKQAISDFTENIKLAKKYFEQNQENNEIVDMEKLDVSKMSQRQMGNLLKELTNLKEFDIRTPEGQKVVKQGLMSQLVKSWSQSSNKVFLSVLMQQVAADKFGLNDDAVSFSSILPEEFRGTPGIFGVLMEMDEAKEKLILSDSQKRAMASVLSAMKDATQEYFKQKGITHVTLYRGMGVEIDDIPEEVRAGQSIVRTLEMRPLSSWSMSRVTASNFGGHGGGFADTNVKAGIIVSSVVPVEDILAIPLTGFGCLNEQEAVVIGRKREGVMSLSQNAYVNSRILGRAKGSPDWPTRSSVSPIQRTRQIEAIDEYREVFESFTSKLDDFVKKITTEKASEISFEERLSSGRIDRRTRVKLDRGEIEKRAKDFIIEFDEPTDLAGARETLKKAYMGGYTVELDSYSDIKEGISVGRNEHGIILRAGEGFNESGEPEPWLVDQFLDWLRLHGPKIFEAPKNGASQVALGGWRTKDGKVYLDVVDIYPETPEFLSRAVQLGLDEDQIAVTRLSRLWALLDAGLEPEEAFIMSGGRGGRTISTKTLKEFSKKRKQLLERVQQTGSPDVIPVGKPLRIELKNHRNSKRVRVLGNDGVNLGEFILFDSADGLSVSAYSGEQLASIIKNPRAKTPTISDLKKLIETQQPVASIHINRGIKENTPVTTYVKNDQKNVPGLFEALSQMHRQFNVNQRDKEQLRISSGAKYPIPPGTNKKPTDSTGFGAMPGDPDGARVKMLPLSLVRQYREFDRANETENLPGYSENFIKQLTEELINGGVIKEPLILEHSRFSNWGYISEGNHRLIAAERAGLSHVPVVVYSRDEGLDIINKKKMGRGGPLTLVHPRMWARNERDTYVPEMITPALFAELQDDEDRILMKKWEQNKKTDEWRLSSGRGGGFHDFPSDVKRKEIQKLLSRKDTTKISGALRSIAQDYADYRYEMNLDMADALIEKLNSLPDRRNNDEYFAELDRFFFGFDEDVVPSPQEAIADIENVKKPKASPQKPKASSKKPKASPGGQTRINLSDEEKREIISIASRRTDDFSKSVVAQYRRTGTLSDKQWAVLNQMTLRGPRLSSGREARKQYRRELDAQNALGWKNSQGDVVDRNYLLPDDYKKLLTMPKGEERLKLIDSLMGEYAAMSDEEKAERRDIVKKWWKAKWKEVKDKKRAARRERRRKKNIFENFTTHTEPGSFEYGGTVWISDNKTGKAVGFLDFRNDFIIKAYVLPDYRRQGIASHLYDEAKKYNGGLEMRADDFTNDGAAFMSAVTGEEIYQSGDYSAIPQWESKKNKERLLNFEKELVKQEKRK